MSAQLKPSPASLQGSLALPYEEPQLFYAPLGASLADVVEGLLAKGVLHEKWLPYLEVYLNETPCPPEWWAKVRPREGALIGVRARPGFDPITFLVNVAISLAVSALTQAFVGSGPATPSFEQLRDIDGSRNEIARWRKVPAILGEGRMFPPHASKPYTQGLDEKVVLRMLFCWGLGPVSLKNLKIGDTPIAGFNGVKLQHKLKLSDPWPTLFGSSPDEVNGPGLMGFDLGWQTRRTVSDECDLLQVELAYPEGLIFYSSDGSLNSWGTKFRIRYREVDSETGVEGPWRDFVNGVEAEDGHLYELNGYRKQKPFRMNFERPASRGVLYDVGVKRHNADDPGPKAKDAFQWTKLRSFTYSAPVTDPNLAITAMEIEASDQLEGMIDLINGEVYRIAPRWDAEAEEFGEAGETSNPAELLRWIVSGPGAPDPRDPATEIDDAKLGAWAELCHNRGWRCDMELRAGAGQDEIMRQVAQCGRGVVYERDGLLSVAIDDLQAGRAQLFTPKNSWGFRSQRRYAAPTHALRLQFSNSEKDFVVDEMLVYYPGFNEGNTDGGKIVSRQLLGKTTAREVREAGLRIISEDLIRIEDYSWRCDWEHMACTIFSRVGLSHYVIAVGRQPARIKALELNDDDEIIGATLDEEITQIEGESYGLAVRRIDGDVFTVSTHPLANLENGKGRAIAFVGALPEDALAIGDLCVFGDVGIETLDVSVRSIARASHLEAEITAAPYDPALFAGDFEGLTEFSDDTTYSDDSFNTQDLGGWSSRVSREAFPKPPAPEIVNVYANASGIFVDFTYPPETAWRVWRTELYWKRDDDDGVFEQVRWVGGDVRLAPFAAGQLGAGYVMKLVAVDKFGWRTESVTFNMISAAASIPFTGELTKPSAIVATASTGLGGDYSAAGGVFRLKIGDTAIDPIVGVDGVAAAAFAIVSASPGLSISIDEEGVYEITALSVDTGQAVLRATRNGVSLDLIYTIVKALAAAPPEPVTPPSGFTATIAVPAGGGVNLRELADAAGYTGFSDATINFTLADGVNVIGEPGAPNGGVGIDTGVWPVESYDIALTITLASAAQGLGGGGKAGAGGGTGNGLPGGMGGPAIFARLPLTIVNNGQIKGGGGGGGGAGGARGIFFSRDWNAGGGGGGGGAPNGPGGAGGVPSGVAGAAGAAGTLVGPGAGGLGGVNSSYAKGGAGGAGGNYAVDGVTGQNGQVGGKNRWSGATGGSAGAAIETNGHTVVVTGPGVVTGAIV